MIGATDFNVECRAKMEEEDDEILRQNVLHQQRQLQSRGPNVQLNEAEERDAEDAIDEVNTALPSSEPDFTTKTDNQELKGETTTIGNTNFVMPHLPPSVIVAVPQEVVTQTVTREGDTNVVFKTFAPDLGVKAANTAPVDDPIAKELLREASRNPSLIHNWVCPEDSNETTCCDSLGAGLSTPGESSGVTSKIVGGQVIRVLPEAVVKTIMFHAPPTRPYRHTSPVCSHRILWQRLNDRKLHQNKSVPHWRQLTRPQSN